MKKIFILLSLSVNLFSCKKDTATPNNTNTNTSTSNDPSIASFECSGVKINGTLVKDKAASSVSATVSYTGGNGKTYITTTHTSKGVVGLTATLQAGTLANGAGVLTYSITGTPTSAGNASFEISLGGKTCAINVTVDDVVQNSTSGYGSNISDIDGNTYKTVYIGSQQWMAENLKVSKYNDGTAIPNITDNTQWKSLTTGAWAYYNNDAVNNAKYGKLYNWYAVSQTSNGNKNVCPSGWHIPSDADEWTVLIDYLGDINVAGGKMKESGLTSWNSPNTDASNTSLFTSLPGGYRDYNGIYYNNGKMGMWWSSTEYGTLNAWNRNLGFSSGGAGRSGADKKHGFSVRCVRD
jgi:uncharacterized protein (TIGR02145 family)